MPQKLNKAGKMQDYIPKGNGDASGEYGTSNGTNKNFTTADKKKSSANVITENKSVVVGDNKGKKTIKVRDEEVEVVEKMPDGFAVDDLLNKTSPYTPDGYLWVSDYETSSLKDRQYKLIEKDKWYNRFKEQETKANIIDGDLTGKKERAYDGSEYKSMSKEERQKIIDKLEKAGARKDTNFTGGTSYEIYDKDLKKWNKISFSEDGKMFTTTINGGVYTYDDLDTAIDRATYKSGKAPSDKAIGWETGTYNQKVFDAYSRKHTKYND